MQTTTSDIDDILVPNKMFTESWNINTKTAISFCYIFQCQKD